MFFQRKIYPFLKKHLKSRQMTILTGMRRTGKTTLLKKLLQDADSKNKLYLDLERVDARDLFSQKNYEEILNYLEQSGLDRKKKMYLAIDELQMAPQAPSALKYLYDHYNIKIFVTGSSSYYLKNLFSESLSGRKKLFELHPLDFGEFLDFKKIPHKTENFLTKKFSKSEYERVKSHYEEYIAYGGFPEVVLSKTEQEKKDIISDIISSYINIDIKSLADFKNQENMYSLMKMLASRVGTKLDYSKLSRIIGISRPTIMQYMQFLEKTYIISRLPVKSKNPDKEIVKAKKLYFCDNGIIRCLAQISSGAQFENAVFSQLKSKGELQYYSRKTGNEIDFVLNDTWALETKESPSEDDKKNLAHLSRAARIPHCRLIGRQTIPKFNDYIWGGDIR